MSNDSEAMSTDDETSQGNPQRDHDRDQWYQLRDIHINEFNRHLAEIADEDLFGLFFRSDLQVREKGLQRHFNKMEEAHQRYRQTCFVASNDIYETMEAKLMAVIAKIKDRLRVLSERDQDSFSRETAAQSTMFQQPPPMIRVETARPSQIGQFNGNQADWPAFRDVFIAEVHNKDLEPVIKLRYLQEACVGKAAVKLGTWQPVSENYAVAWGALKGAYDDDYHVIHGIISRALAIPKQERESYDALSAVVDVFANCVRQLETVADIQTRYDQLLIHLIKQRLPRYTLDAWEQHRNRNGTPTLPTFAEFKKFLEAKSKGRREYEPDGTNVAIESTVGKTESQPIENRPKPYDRSKGNHNQRSTHATRDVQYGRGGPRACIMSGCGQTHYLGQCIEFRKLPRNERMTVRRHNLCHCCLLPGHYSQMCQRNGCSGCPEAKIKHHFRLCPKIAPDSKPSPQNMSQSAEPRPQ